MVSHALKPTLVQYMWSTWLRWWSSMWPSPRKRKSCDAGEHEQLLLDIMRGFINNNYRYYYISFYLIMYHYISSYIIIYHYISLYIILTLLLLMMMTMTMTMTMMMMMIHIYIYILCLCICIWEWEWESDVWLRVIITTIIINSIHRYML